MLEGQDISHYELSEKLGEGGMGVVYKAWDRKLNRFVALKFLSGSWANSAEQVTRFQLEAQAISALNHPNIATIYEIDEADGRCFLALEYLPGGTLKTALDQLAAAGQQLSVEQGLEYALQLTEGVAHAHSHGIIHRDIKSANALFTESGAVKLTDFGLAKLARGINVTQTGSVMGTPASMSPEQAQGLETDERSDVFSLGVIMFELFAGELPFRGDNALAMLHQIVNVKAPLLGEHHSGIPVALERIVAKALERDPAERYQSAANLAADLRTLRRELLFGSSVRRSSLETVAIGTAPVRRRRGPPLKRTLGVITACVVLGSASWMAWPWVRARTTSWFRQSLPAEKRLAILPFRNVGGNSKDQAFVDGLREVVINKLARLERPVGALVVVVSPDEVRVKEIRTAADAWKRLGANLVMTGSVVTAGQQSQLIVNLEDPQTLTVLRSETIDASHSDLMVQSEKLVRMLELGLNDQTRQTLQAGDSHNPEAAHYYVEGLGYLLRFDRVENLDLSATAFRDAISKDPNYALAWAGLAQALGEKYKIQKDPAVLAEAADYGGRALHLNGRLAAVHITMGEIQLAQGQYVAAAQELQTALKIELANSKAFHILGDAYQAMGKYEEAEATYKKAIELRPGDAAGYYYLGTFYFRRERLPAAELSFRRAVELAPDSYLALSNLGGIYLRMGRYSEAVDQFVKSVSIAPSARAYGNLGAAYYYLQSYAEAVQPYQRAVDMAPKDSANWGNLADAYRWTPALKEQAPAAFRRAIELLEQEIKVDPRNPRLHARLAMYHASIGNRGPALAEITDALGLDPSQAYVQYRAGLVYEETGDRDNALNHIELALHAGEPRAEILAAPPLEQLRKDFRFARIAGPQP